MQTLTKCLHNVAGAILPRNGVFPERIAWVKRLRPCCNAAPEGSIAQFRLHLVEVDLAHRHLVGGVFEVVFEQVEIAMIDLVD